MQIAKTKKALLHLIKTAHLPIYEQLQIEEALLHTTDQNFCLFNSETLPAIVMGLSNDEKKLLNLEEIKKRKISVYKRFSGGGTVFIDENTLLVSMIQNQKDTQDLLPYPEAIMRFHYEIYKEVFNREDFHCIENDFVLKEKKCGGNAQYIKKERWLQHSTFLWDFSLDNLSLLKMPQKAPLYRKEREHQDFLTSIRSLFPSKEHFFDSLQNVLSKRFEIEEMSVTQAKEVLLRSYRKQNQIIF